MLHRSYTNVCAKSLAAFAQILFVIGLALTFTYASGGGEAQGASVTNSAQKANGRIVFSRAENGPESQIYTMKADGSDVIQLTFFSDNYSCRWSPDGTKIVFVSRRDGNAEIYVMNADGGNQTRLTNDSGWDQDPTWSPDGQKITFVSDRSASGQHIYTMNPDGSNQTRLTINLGANDIHPAWSPDGAKLAFAHLEPSGTNNNNYEIYTIDANGTNQTNLTNDGGNDYYPAWSPDGSKIVFSSLRNHTQDVYLMNADGSNQTKLTSLDATMVPSWSPDGSKILFTNLGSSSGLYLMNPDGSALSKISGTMSGDNFPSWQALKKNGKIAFVSARDGNDEIYVMNADGSSQARLSNNNDFDLDPAWSPDGSKLAFTSTRDMSTGGRDIYAMDADGSNVLRLTTSSSDDRNPDWSPDGSKIIFVSERDGNGEIYVMNADGSGQTRLTQSSEFESEPVWSPDGQKIAYTRNVNGTSEIFVMNADGSSQTQITNNVFNAKYNPAWSPDGTKIALTYQNGAGQIYVMNADGSQLTNLSHNFNSDSSPSWSPDGTLITFTSNRNAGNQVFVMNADGSGQTQITNGPDQNYQSAWGPLSADATPVNPVSGHVRDINGNGIGGVTLTISGAPGGQTISTQTDANGSYFLNNSTGGDTLTPSKSGYIFSPSSVRAVSSRGIVPITGSFDFQGGTNVYTLSGKVIDGTGAGLSGVLITVSGSMQAMVPVNADGTYTIGGLFAGGSYTLTPSRSGYAFNPTSARFSSLSSDKTVPTFVGTTHPYNITGHIQDANNTGLSGVQVTLSRVGGSETIVITATPSGNYFFQNVASEATYTVTPSKAGYSFNPQSITFSNPVGNQTANFVGTPASQSPTLQFSAATYSVNEGEGSKTITVTRSGDTSATSSVDYATSDGTAQQRADYTIASGTLTFAPGETAKTFTVLITDDAYLDGNKTVTLNLSNATVGSLSNPSTALLTITDNDTVQPTTNPIDNAQFFVRQHYLDFLNREADAGGLDYWSSQITQCGSDQNCINSRRIGVSAAYFIELEFQDTGSFVYRFYKASYGVRPTYAQFMPDRSRVVGGANLDAGKAAFAENWVTRPEFVQKYPATLSGTQFIDALLQTVQQGSGVDLSAKRQSLIADYNTNQSRGRIVQLIAEDETLKAAEYNRAFVLMQYFGYLRRDPDQGGYDFWLDVLNNRVANNYRGMVCAFLTSAEYQDRFSSVITRNDQICASITP